MKIVSDILRSRQLIQALVSTNLKADHKYTVLGYIWWLLDPLLMMMVYFLLVSVIFKRGGPRYPFFVICALLPWSFFSHSLMQSIDSLTGKFKLLKQVAFPKVVLPLSVVLSNLVNLFFGLLVLIPMSIIFRIVPNANILLLPVIILLHLLFTIGISLILSIMNVYFRDLKLIFQYFLKIWFYLSPGLYSIDLVPERFQPIYNLNPNSFLFTGYRRVLMEGDFLKAGEFVYLTAVCLLFFFMGIYIFSKKEMVIIKSL